MKNKVEVISKRAWKFDKGLALVIGAAVFQAYQFGRALNIYDPIALSVAGINLGGLFLGAIVNVIIVLAATRLPMLLAAATPSSPKSKNKNDLGEKRRARLAQKAGMQAMLAQAAFFALMGLSPLLVAPALYILWVALPLHPTLVMSLSVGWAVAPDLAIALGGFVAGKSLVQFGDAPASHSAPQSAGRAKKSDASATESAVSAADSAGPASKYPRRCEYCASDSPFAMLKSANAVGGHMKAHHPESCNKKTRTGANAEFVAIVAQSAKVEQ